MYVWYGGFDFWCIADSSLVTELVIDSHLSEVDALPDDCDLILADLGLDLVTDREVAATERHLGVSDAFEHKARV